MTRSPETGARTERSDSRDSVTGTRDGSGGLQKRRAAPRDWHDPATTQTGRARDGAKDSA